MNLCVWPARSKMAYLWFVFFELCVGWAAVSLCSFIPCHFTIGWECFFDWEREKPRTSFDAEGEKENLWSLSLSWRARDPTFSLFWPAGFQQDDHYYTIKCGCSGGWGGRKKWSREPEELLFLSPPEFLFIHGSHQADWKRKKSWSKHRQQQQQELHCKRFELLFSFLSGLTYFQRFGSVIHLQQQQATTECWR